MNATGENGKDSNSTREIKMSEQEIVHPAARDAIIIAEKKEGLDSLEITESETTENEEEKEELAAPLKSAGSIPSLKKKKNAKAFLSKVADQRLCVNSITIGNEFVETSYQDSCATHNFLSPRYSDELVRLGYQRYKCPPMDVEQGTILERPTTKVHLLRLTMISPAGDIVRWDNCLFLVADAGADVLIGNPILEIGNIMKYVPPDGYEATLKSQISLYRDEPIISDLEARKITRRVRTYEYPKPTEIKHMGPIQIRIPDPGYDVFDPRVLDARVHENIRNMLGLPAVLDHFQEMPALEQRQTDNKKERNRSMKVILIHLHQT